MLGRLFTWVLSGLMVAVLFLTPAFGEEDKLKKEELQQLLAPIALYPDELLTNVLIASTYPLDVVQAARWRADKNNAKLKGDALVKALESKEWDPSIKALVQFPEVLSKMSEKLEWTQKLGDAFLAQQDDVMDQIQFLRNKAVEAGNLKSNKQQKVVRESGSGGSPVYVIEPATPETVYVPVYQPTVVYGDWWYPSYPPYAWTYPGASFVNGFWWGAGVAIAGGIWGWNNCDWNHHDINIDVDKWNNINVDRDKIVNKKWEHRPEQRGSVPYRNKETREKFKQANGGPKGKDEFRGRDRAQIENKLKDKDRPRPDNKVGDAGKTKDRPRPDNKVGDAGKAKDRPGSKATDRAGSDRPKAQNADRKAPGPKKDLAKAKKPSPSAFDVKSGSDAQRNAARGKVSRNAMKPSAGPRPGGGGGRAGGGRPGGGGGRR